MFFVVIPLLLAAALITGAIATTAGTIVLNNSTISGNTGTTDGGGIYVNGGTVTLLNDTITNNTATAGQGGGLNRVAGTVNVNWIPGHGITDIAPAPNAFAGGAWTYELDPNAGTPDLVITEILAANVSGLVDEDGEQEDWIEIQNQGAFPVDLAGWSLSRATRLVIFSSASRRASTSRSR